MSGIEGPATDLRGRIEALVRGIGLAPRGVVRLGTADCDVRLADGRAVASVMMIGWRGRDGWAAFAGAPERGDGEAHPLDRWSMRVIGEVARAVGGVALFPFAGPPFLPFQRWGARAEGLTATPLGLSIDGEVGLWHGWRGAIGVSEDLGDEVPSQASPCETCERRSCLSACPASAFDVEGHHPERCRDFLESHAGGLCRTDGCRARDACPVGRRHRYAPDQIRFLMGAHRAFLAEMLP